MPHRLETSRLILQPFAAHDAAFYAELIAERGPGGRGYGTTEDGARLKIAQLAEQAEATGIGFLSIRRRQQGDVIGYCGLLVGRASIDEPELAFELIRTVHGNGYATEAAVAMIAAAAATGRRRLWATIRVWNDQSFRVLQRTGFRRDHIATGISDGDLVYLVRDL